MNAPGPSLLEEFQAAMDWWRMAGVDLDFVDDATVWTADNAAPAASEGTGEHASVTNTAADRFGKENSQESAPAQPRTKLLGDSPPADLEAFRDFWLTAPGLDAIGPRGRVAPRGPAEPGLMVLVIDPEESDGEKLLAGPQGRLLANMLAAMGMAESETYIASALPRHTPMADTASIAASGMNAVLRHHIALVSPQRILAFGRNILPLIGHDQTQDVMSLREINHGAGTTPILVGDALDTMLSMPQLKGRFWRRWMGWTADT